MLDTLRKDFLELVENEDLQKNKELFKTMAKMTINNLFDYLESLSDETKK